jgi:outer membrane receptor protein involved in Fe transport
MNLFKKLASLETILFLLISFSSLSFAGTTGKIAGKIFDKKTGENIPFVTVTVVGESYGAIADAEGNYVILNVRPGKYSLKASAIGYQESITEDVIVRVDLTTTVDFYLAEENINVGEVVVKAKQTMINKDETSRTSIISSQTFSDLPVASFQDVVSLQAGFVTGSDGTLHARGGRSGEVTYLIDGVPQRDPLSGSFTGQVDKYAIEELQVLTGGFNAEYGQALSGVVNIVTKEGGNKLKGRIEYSSDQLNPSPFHKADALAYDEWGFDENGKYVRRVDTKGENLVNNYPSAYKKQSLNNTPDIGLDANILGQFSGVLSGPLPVIDNLKFFTTARYLNSLDQKPWGYNKEREFNGKLTYTLNDIKFNLGMQRFYRAYKPYSHIWKYNPDGYEDRKDFSWRDNLRINHVLSSKAFYDASLSYNRRYFLRYQPGREAIFSPDGQLLYSNYLMKNSSSPPFWTNADNGVYIRNNVQTFLAKFDYTTQLGTHNLLKTGIEIQKHIISRYAFKEPYPSGFHGFENYTKRPTEISAYIQDKLEFNSFIINVGVRYDYADVNDTKWESLRNPAGYLNDDKIWIPVDEVATPAKQQISPRLGIAFPITDKTVFYSSYGHFFQLPEYSQMYASKDPTQDQALIGNPGIAPQKTVAFEFGVKQEIGAGYSLDIGAYFKDITNLVGSTYLTVFPYEYTVFDNSNYGGVSGFEITFKKALSDYWFANINYTYSIAKGNESDPLEGFNDYRRASALLRPKRVFYLDFDRTHVVYSTIGLEFPENFGPSVFGINPLENTSLNIIAKAESGLPYTPRKPEESNDLLVEKNSGRMPSSFRVDLRFSRYFPVGEMKFTLFAIVNNLFDQIIATNVWNTSGDPLDAGPTYNRTRDRMRNPDNIDIRRSIQCGIRIDF